MIVDKWSHNSAKKGKQPIEKVEADMSKRNQTLQRRTNEFHEKVEGGTPLSAKVKTPLLRTTRKAYEPHGTGHVKLNLLQEFLMYMIYLRRGLDYDILAEKFFGSTSTAAKDRTASVIRTFAAALHEILRAEDWWLMPEEARRVQSHAFENEVGMNSLIISDCTNGMNCEGGPKKNELIRQHLWSTYYHACCGKVCVAMSRIGGCVAVGDAQGGPAGDHQCLDAAGLFSSEKWAQPAGRPLPGHMYDAGASARSKSASLLAGCSLVTSGISRKSKSDSLSYQQRSNNFQVSSMRIRVENFIGIVKQRFKVLGKILPMHDLGMMNKLVYACFMLHNFGVPKVK
jgi:hypothetical protein